MRLILIRIIAVAILVLPFQVLASPLTGFTLIDAQFNSDLYVLSDGDTINLANTPIISIRADIDSVVSKIEFYLDNVLVRTESVAPYAINGDAGGNYNPWTGYVKNVYHKLKAYAFNGNLITDSLIINFVVVDSINANPPQPPIPGSPIDTISGELRKWHKVTLTFPGPAVAEDDVINPFLNYRFNVTFTKGAKSYIIPGFFAADGMASETSADSGNYWRTHFTPDEEGLWSYSISFVTGLNVAINSSPGTPLSLDGFTGSFFIYNTNKKVPDLRAKGRLEYVGEHYLQFQETGEYFIKNGTNSPENILGYYEFDNTANFGGDANTLDGPPYFDGLHHFDPHLQDWNIGDPTWKNGKGKRIIGALNYLASEKLNSVFVSLNTRNAGGDDAFPWIDYNQFDRYDVSKLEQWDILFSHMDKLGLASHFLLSERENEGLLDGGNLGNTRKLYHRELIARFGYHLGICWDVGEENTNTLSQVEDIMEHFTSINPYNTFFVLHTLPGGYSRYNYFLGDTLLGGASFQVQCCAGPNIDNSVNNQNIYWRNVSQNSGHKWVLYADEVGPPETGLTADGPGNNHTNRRINHLWGAVLGGGAGSEYFFGYQTPHNDINCEDFRSRDNFWDYTSFLLNYFENYIPFNELIPDNNISPSTNDYCFVKYGEQYTIYITDFPNNQLLDLQNYNTSFAVQWYDPRNGGNLISGSQQLVTGPGLVQLGNPPNSFNEDWVILVRDTSIIEIKTDVAVNNNECEGKSTGSISVDVRDGIPPFSIIWSTGDTSFQLNNLSKGWYTYSITDAINNNLIDSVFVDEPQILQITSSIRKITCSSIDNATIKVSVAGGNTPYTYLWSSGSSNSVISGLSNGQYQITCTDVQGCSVQKDFAISAPISITVQETIVNESVPGAGDGSITIYPSGGTPPYEYHWNVNPAQFDNQIGSLFSGNYKCLVTDKMGCAILYTGIVN